MAIKERHIKRYPGIDSNRDRVLEKIKENKRLGWERLALGTREEFKGWPAETLKRQIRCVLEFDSDSTRQVMERVVYPISQLAEKYQIPAIVPGESDPLPHFTLNIIKTPQDMHENERENIFGRLLSDKSHIRSVLDSLCSSQPVMMDNLVVGPSSIICSSNPPDDFYRARQIIENICEGLDSDKLQSIDYSDIVHSTILRVSGAVTSETLAKFATKANQTVGADLKNRPVPVRIGNAGVSTAFDYMRVHAPEQIRYPEKHDN